MPERLKTSGRWIGGEVASGRIPVYVYAADPISQAGTASQLRGRPELHVVEESAIDRALVAVVASDEVDEPTRRTAAAIQRNGCPKVVLVVRHLDDAGLLAAVEAGVSGIVRRQEATPERLVAAIAAAAAGEGDLSPDLVGRLLTQVCHLQRQVLAPHGFNFAGLTDRELDVLRLLADGQDTLEVAEKLCYSERTVKKLVQDVTRRHNLRNRTHAVAYAMRLGLL